jgi:cytochrome c oxidase subunit III
MPPGCVEIAGVTAIAPPGVTPDEESPPVIRPVNPADYRPALLNVGVIVWLASELMFFSGLFAAYFALRAAGTPAHPFRTHAEKLDVVSVLVATILLVLSSGTMQMAVHRSTKSDKAGFLGWLALSFCLGALFDGMQLSDWVNRPFAISTNSFGSTFYVLTGIHGLHVGGGLVGMIIMGIRAYRTKRFGRRTLPAIEFLSYSWHFVDVVWIALFIAIFLMS